jgi:hypothetical protein
MPYKKKELFNKKINKREGKKVKRLYINLLSHYLVLVCRFKYFLVVLHNISKIV